jgi:hypothetical protein
MRACGLPWLLPVGNEGFAPGADDAGGVANHVLHRMPSVEDTDEGQQNANKIGRPY